MFRSSNTSIYLVNDSGSAWYVAVTSNGDGHRVARVEDGAEGFALEWMGESGQSLSVLNAMGTEVGTLARQADGSYALEAVLGLKGRMEDHPPMPWERRPPGVEYTADCRGMFLA